MKRLFSGIQPSGNLHIGNYLGAVRQWIDLQNDHEALFCIVDLHAITVPQDPAELRKKTLEIAKIYLAAGIDPEQCTLFVQSHVKEHTELGWVLNTIARIGDLDKMTQFKEKASVRALAAKAFNQKMGESISSGTSNRALAATAYEKKIKGIKFERLPEEFGSVGVGLFDYPVLMAADILLYDAAVVPVGKDQMQHIELARTLAERFNKRFGETFAVPQGKLSQVGQLIMGLDDPTKKMSKSAASEYNAIALADDAETVRRKIRKAVTDSGSDIVYRDDKPALKNLINIYSLLSDKSTADTEKAYEGKGYAEFKHDLAEVVVAFLEPFQKKVAELSDQEVMDVLERGAERARGLAVPKMQEVRKKIGLL